MEMKITESHCRLYDKLYRDFGKNIIDFLQDQDVNEIMLNPDGKLWIDRTSQGQLCVDEMQSTQAFSIMNTIAGIHGLALSHQQPRLEAELPFYHAMQGQRFTGAIPPVIFAPSFNIRKRAEIIFTLEDYIKTNRVTLQQSKILTQLIIDRKNILVCGGPGSGKTTVTNALIIEAIKNDPQQRFIILEDLPELQCNAMNKVSMLTCDSVNMTALLRDAMRRRPDRILIGEVRGAEALAMLKAWNTGCPGGICTVHANGAEEAIQRILDLSMESGLAVQPIPLILHTIHAIVYVTRKSNQKGFIQEILKLEGYQNEKFIFKKLC